MCHSLAVGARVSAAATVFGAGFARTFSRERVHGTIVETPTENDKLHDEDCRVHWEDGETGLIKTDLLDLEDEAEGEHAARHQRSSRRRVDNAPGSPAISPVDLSWKHSDAEEEEEEEVYHSAGEEDERQPVVSTTAGAAQPARPAQSSAPVVIELEPKLAAQRLIGAKVCEQFDTDGGPVMFSGVVVGANQVADTIEFCVRFSDGETQSRTADELVQILVGEPGGAGTVET